MEQAARFNAAMQQFDEANAQDPSGEALRYAKRMSEWLVQLAPDASEPLRLAARSQHLCRWSIPRDSYPMTRAGYHRWRSAAAEFHAQKAGEILRDVGYEPAVIQRVQSLLRKENLKSDADMQMLEDVICLVFLENYFSDFAQRHDEAKLLTILRRTWAKMSPRGQAAAMALPLSHPDRELILKASGETEST